MLICSLGLVGQCYREVSQGLVPASALIFITHLLRSAFLVHFTWSSPKLQAFMGRNVVAFLCRVFVFYSPGTGN